MCCQQFSTPLPTPLLNVTFVFDWDVNVGGIDSIIEILMDLQQKVWKPRIRCKRWHSYSNCFWSLPKFKQDCWSLVLSAGFYCFCMKNCMYALIDQVWNHTFGSKLLPRCAPYAESQWVWNLRNKFHLYLIN